MIEKLTDYLIERRHKKQNFNVGEISDTPEDRVFKRVLNTLRRNKVMVKLERDGVYLRLAGDWSMGGINCPGLYAKVVDFTDGDEDKIVS